MGHDKGGVYHLEPYIYLYCIEDVCRPAAYSASFL